MSNYLLDLWDALHFYFVFVLIPAGVLGVIVVHFVVLFVARKTMKMRSLFYPSDMLMLKMALSVTYCIFYNNREVFSNAGKTQAIIVMLSIHVVVRGLYSWMRTKKRSSVSLELVMIALESFVISLFEHIGLFYFL